MKKIVLYIVALIIGFLTLFTIYLLDDPYYKIRNSEPETGLFYLSYYQRIMRKQKFDSLLKRLIKENMDLKSMGTAVNYVVNNNLCYFSQEIEKKCNYLRSFPLDTVWEENISKSYTMVWTMEASVFDRSMCFRLQELKKECKN